MDEYEAKKIKVSGELIDRMDAVFPGLKQNITFKEVSYAVVF